LESKSVDATADLLSLDSSGGAGPSSSHDPTTSSNGKELASADLLDSNDDDESDYTEFDSDASFSDLEMFRPKKYSVPFKELHWREKLHFLLHNEAKSKLALSYQLFQAFVLILSIVVFLVQSLPAYWQTKNLPMQIIVRPTPLTP